MKNNIADLVEIKLDRIPYYKKPTFWEKIFRQPVMYKFGVVLSAVNADISTVKIISNISEYDARHMDVIVNEREHSTPVIHSYFKTATDAFGYQLSYIVIDKIVDKEYQCLMCYSNGEHQVQVISRLTDAITISYYHKAPMYATKEALAQVAAIKY